VKRLLLYKPAAQRELSRMDRSHAERIMRALEVFAATGHGDVKALKGALKGRYRLRAGKWRAAGLGSSSGGRAREGGIEKTLLKSRTSGGTARDSAQPGDDSGVPCAKPSVADDFRFTDRKSVASRIGAYRRVSVTLVPAAPTGMSTRMPDAVWTG
jgi:hypothetical protein